MSNKYSNVNMRGTSKARATDGREFKKGDIVEVTGKGLGIVEKATKTYVIVNVAGFVSTFKPEFVKELD